MDQVLVIAGLAVIVAVAAVWFLRRRTQGPDEDEWALPPEVSPEQGQSTEPQLFDRNALMHRNRALDPTKWDNSPDGSEPMSEAEPDDLPRVFDRDYLAKRQQPRPEDDIG